MGQCMDLASNAHAQAGVDELKHQFRNADGAPVGVRDIKAGAER